MESIDWMEAWKREPVPEEVGVVVCPAFVQLDAVKQAVDELRLSIDLGAQTVSAYPFGAYTGAVAAGMLKDLVSYVIVGHSERRKHFGETSQQVAQQVTQALDMGLQPIVCVDRPYMREQVNALDESQLTKVMYAYEPLHAIGTGEPEKPTVTQEVGQELLDMVGEPVSVLYGGSTDPENVADYTELEAIDGVLVGGSSLKPDVFAAMARKMTDV